MTGASIFWALNKEWKQKQGGAPSSRVKMQVTVGKNTFATNYARRIKGIFIRRTLATTGAKFQAIAKSSFVKTSRSASTRLHNYLNYIQNRERSAFEKERTFFTKDRSGLDYKDIEKEVEDRFGDRIAFHKLILSPGDNNVSLEGYVRDTMKDLEKTLGQELDYWAVSHLNTDHYHAHVVVAGMPTTGGKDVHLDREDLAELREAGNQYLARERMMDRTLDRQLEVQFDLRDKDYFDVALQKDLGLTPFREWTDQIETGIPTNLDLVKEQHEFGYDRLFDLGKPFKAIDHDDSESSLIDFLYSSQNQQTTVDRDELVNVLYSSGMSPVNDTPSVDKDRNSGWNIDLADLEDSRDEDDRFSQRIY